MNDDRFALTWTRVCKLDEIVPNTGVCALVKHQQVAVFRVEGQAGGLYAIDNFDPASRAAVLSRGLVGSLGERTVVASPIYKHHYDLRTGECLEEPEMSIATFAVQVRDEHVWVSA
jgi:nitrite reductase (NADH) small subunit